MHDIHSEKSISEKIHIKMDNKIISENKSSKFLELYMANGTN